MSENRRRGAVLQQAIFDATWELLLEEDPEQLSMGAVAERVGTSKPVLYRRWPNRAELIVATLQARTPTPVVDDDDHGSLRADLIALMHSAAAWFTRIPPAVVRSLRAATAADPELRALLPAQISMVDIRPALRAALNRAAARGEATGAAFGDRALKLPLDLMRLESLDHLPVPNPDDVIADIVDQVLLPLFTGRSAG